MENTLSWPIIRLIQRLSMVLTLGCCVYVIFFLFFNGRDDSMSENSQAVPVKSIALVSPSPVFDLKPYDVAVGAQARDIFSLDTSVGPSGAVENTPKGQLPEHLKIVGILIGDPSQIIIEDAFAKKTYFINEGSAQAGIKIVQASKERMVINYQGQDIIVPVSKF
jgi:hypothetical protein